MYEVIYSDKNAQVKDYENLLQNELLVTSVFPTIQGEGPYAGHRALFIRLSGCNYGSKGVRGQSGCLFCDSDFRLALGKKHSFSDLWDMMEKRHPGYIIDHIGRKRKLVVITGGEPFLQKNIAVFLWQTYFTYGDKYYFQIESNGFAPPSNLPDNSLAYVVVSPKIPERLESDSKKAYPALNDRTLSRSDCLKILVSADKESPYNVLPPYVFDYAAKSKKPVYLSPINVYKSAPKIGEASIWDREVYDHKACATNHAYAARLCEDFGFRLSVQQHLFCAIA